MIAAKGEFDKFIDYKFNKGQVDAYDCFGMRPVHYAAYYGHCDLVQLLSAAGFGTKDNKEKYSVLECALQNKQDQIAYTINDAYPFKTSGELLSAIKDNNKMRVLCMIIRVPTLVQDQGVKETCFKIYEKYQQNRNVAEKVMLFVMQCTLERRLLMLTNDILQDMALCGANINVQNVHGLTVLYIAVNKGNLECLKELLKHKDIDVNKQRGIGVTALHVAASTGNLECLEALHKAGADINKQLAPNVTNPAGNNRGLFTPLHLAIAVKRGPAIRKLIALGADPMLKTSEGKTARQLAEENAMLRFM